MSKHLRAIDLEKTRIGSEAMDQLYKEGWRRVCRLLPTEYDQGGDVLRNWHIFENRGTPGGNGGAIDLTEVWEVIGKLGLSIDAMDQLVKDVQLRVAVLEQTGDLAEIVKRLDGFDIAIDTIGQVHDQFRLEIDELKQGAGGANFSTEEILVEIWSYCDKTGELRQQPVYAINVNPKFTYAYISGNTLFARFTIGAGGDVYHGDYLIRPLMDVSSYVSKNPLGNAAYEGAKNGFTLQGQAMWKKYEQVDGPQWFIRMSSPTYDYFEKMFGGKVEKIHGEEYRRPVGMAGGDRYWGKEEGKTSFPWNSFGGDVVWATILLPST